MSKPPKDDAWERFERAVDASLNAGPKHRTSPKPTKDKKAAKAPKDKPPGGKPKP